MTGCLQAGSPSARWYYRARVVTSSLHTPLGRVHVLRNSAGRRFARLPAPSRFSHSALPPRRTKPTRRTGISPKSSRREPSFEGLHERGESALARSERFALLRLEGSQWLDLLPRGADDEVKKPLFDQVKLSAQLSDLSHHAHDPQNLPFNSLTFSKDRKTFTFNADSSRWEWDVATEMLKRLGPATTGRRCRRTRSWQRWWRRRRDGAPRRQPDTANTCGGNAGGGRQAAVGWGGSGRRRPRRRLPQLFARQQHVRLCARSQPVPGEGRVRRTRPAHQGRREYYSFGARDTAAGAAAAGAATSSNSSSRTINSRRAAAAGGGAASIAIRVCARTSPGRPTRRRSS